MTGRHGGEATSGRHAEHGKVTICHATGSATNPYVEITISRNALKAHARHQDGRDLLSVPAGGCPTGAGSQVLQGNQGETSDHGKVTICHATGSLTNPFVLITIALNALAAHAGHQNGEDILNPTGPCPGALAARNPAGVGGAAPSPAIQVLATETVASSSPNMSSPAAAAPASGRGVKGVSARSPSSASPAGAGAAPVRTASSGRRSLPFTGFDAFLVALIGALSILIGWRTRKAASPGD